MKPTTPSYDAAAEDQAALWAAKIDGSSLSGDDHRALESWLAAHPSHRLLLSSFCQLSADLEQQVPLLEGIKDLPAENSSAEATARLLPWLSRPVWAGAMLTAAAAVALALWVGRVPTQTETVATPAAQRQSLALADGTEVEVDVRTRLDIVINRNERRATLAGGQAFFAVAKDAKRPFIIETPAGSVHVTGTRFNVRSEAPGMLEVTVTEGSVTVRPADAQSGDQPFALSAGTRYASGRVSTVAARELEALLAWRHGQVIFNDVPLDEALAYFARHHDRVITATAAAAAERIGGRHSADDLEGFLSFLEEALNAHVVRRSNGAVEVRLRSER